MGCGWVKPEKKGKQPYQYKPDHDNYNPDQPVHKAKKSRPFKGQGVAVGGGGANDANERELRAAAAEKRLKENQSKGFNKASLAEAERKQKLYEQMDKEKGGKYNMRW